MNKINFKIITPERVVFEDQVDQVSLTTPDGEITVLPHHIPLVTTMVAGELRYKKNGQEFFLAVSGGFTEVRGDNTLVVLADTAESAPEIDLTRAQEAHDRAKKLMEESRDQEDVGYAALQSKIEKEVARLRVGNKYRKLPKQ